MAYTSGETGQNEVYVRAFLPDASVETSAKWMISNQGGRAPQWSRDGRKVYWVSAGNGVLYQAHIDTTSGFYAGLSIKMFEAPTATGGNNAVNSRGQMLLRTPVEHASIEPLQVLVNWRSAPKASGLQ